MKAQIKNRSQRDILRRLKTMGQQTTEQLAEHIQRTIMGARKHLLQLESEGFVKRQYQAKGKGRPGLWWQLSGNGHRTFSDGHGQLIGQLLIQLKELSPNTLEQLVEQREQQQANDYSVRMADCRSVSQRLAVLTEIRCEEGYMAELVEEEQHWLLVEHHCPICSAASHCQGFCRSELALFEQLLQTKVTREEHLLAGGSRCRYRIEKPAKS